VSVFDKALYEVERTMRTDMYPKFLTSDLYIQYAQRRATESPQGAASTSSNSSSGCNSIRPTSRLLPTLHENEEFQTEVGLRKGSGRSVAIQAAVPLSKAALAATMTYRGSSGTSER